MLVYVSFPCDVLLICWCGSKLTQHVRQDGLLLLLLTWLAHYIHNVYGTSNQLRNNYHTWVYLHNGLLPAQVVDQSLHICFHMTSWSHDLNYFRWHTGMLTSHTHLTYVTLHKILFSFQHSRFTPDILFVQPSRTETGQPLSSAIGVYRLPQSLTGYHSRGWIKDCYMIFLLSVKLWINCLMVSKFWCQNVCVSWVYIY
jgi:hypothetical protein